MEDNRGGLKTLIAVLAGFDSIKKNNDLVQVFHELYDKGDNRETLREFHFLFTGAHSTASCWARLIQSRCRPNGCSR